MVRGGIGKMRCKVIMNCGDNCRCFLDEGHEDGHMHMKYDKEWGVNDD